MTVTAARAEFIKAGFRTVDAPADSAVVVKYGDAARKTTEPVPTFFESAADAEAMRAERMTLLSKDRRRFDHVLSGENIGLGLAYSQTAPQCTVIDQRRQADHPAIVAEITIDFGKQISKFQTWGGLAPDLYLDFTSGVLDPRVTFSRGSHATLFDNTGRITFAPNNLAVRSEQFDNSAWTKALSNVSPNTATAPNGTLTADTWTPTSTATAATVRLIATIATAAGPTFTSSIYVKSNGKRWVYLTTPAATSAAHNCWFDVQNGVAGTIGGAATGSSIESVGDGWYRISVTSPVVATTNYIFLSATDANGSLNVTADGNGLFVWGAQLEQVTYETTARPYNPTTTAAYYGPRFDYNPVTLAPRGLLVEEARTNLFIRSEEFDNGVAWVVNNASVTANAAMSPDGTVDADKIVEDGATSTHRIVTGLLLTAVPHTMTVYAKAAERNWIVLGNASDNQFAFFNISTGAVGTISGTTTPSITPAGNGWFRCSVTFTPTAASRTLAIWAASADNVASYTGVANSGVLVWGAQLEVGAFATSYIPTTTVAVARNFENVSIGAPHFSVFFNQTEGTFYSDVLIPQAQNDAFTVATGGNRIGIRRQAAGNFVNAYNRIGGSNDIGTGIVFASGRLKTAYAVKSGDSAISVNGSEVAKSANAFTMAETSLYIGQLGPNTAAINGHIRTVGYFRSRLPDAQLVRQSK